MFGDLSKMLKLAGEMKAKLPQLREKLANSEYSAAAGGGAVQVTVNGKMQLVDIKIDPAAIGDGQAGAGQLAEHVKAAISAAQAKAADDAMRAMRELTGGVDLAGLSGMLG